MAEKNQILCFVLLVIVVVAAGKDMIRKSIVFDKNTPDVFYCPIHKPTGFDKMIVKARPLKKLCEFEGKSIPEDYKSDCYQDVDESDYACKEKYRIMMRMHPPGGEDPWDGDGRMAKFLNVDREFYISKMQQQQRTQHKQQSNQNRSSGRGNGIGVSRPQRRRSNYNRKSHLRDRLRLY